MKINKIIPVIRNGNSYYLRVFSLYAMLISYFFVLFTTCMAGVSEGTGRRSGDALPLCFIWFFLSYSQLGGQVSLREVGIVRRCLTTLSFIWQLDGRHLIVWWNWQMAGRCLILCCSW